MRSLAVAVLITTTACGAARASVGPPGSVAPTPQEEPDSHHDYRGWMLAADGAAIAATLASDANDRTVLTYLLVYPFLGAVVHGRHGNDEQAVRSVARRLMYPGAGFAVGWALSGGFNACDGEDCELFPIMTGLGVGMVAGIVHDLVVAEVGDDEPGTIAPIVNGDGDEITVGVRGRF